MEKFFKNSSSFVIDEKLSNFLNLTRWFAAFIVVLSHLRAFSFPAFSELQNPNYFEKFFYLFTSLGHQAVMIFFVISGFLIGREVIRGYTTSSFSWKNYLIKRIIRLYLVLIPALILTVILDNIGYSFFNIINMYDRFFETDKETLNTFMLNVFMLQHSYGPTFGTNDPLWSLAYEFWYYLLFPLLIGLIRINTNIVKVIYISLFLILFLVISIKIKIYFLCWLIGISIWYIKENKFFQNNLFLLITLLLLLCSILLSRYYEYFIYDLFMALMFSLIICFYKNDFLFNSIKYKKLNKLLADFSYSIYLFHYPIAFLLFNIFYEYFYNLKIEFYIYNYLVFIFMILVIYFIVYFIAQVNEFKTKKVTDSILEKFKGR